MQELQQGERQLLVRAVGNNIAQANRGDTAKVTVTGKS